MPFIYRYQCSAPVWSCAWNADDRNYFYAGQCNGAVVVFDIRNTANHVQVINTEGNGSPVASLKYVARNLQALFRYGIASNK